MNTSAERKRLIRYLLRGGAVSRDEAPPVGAYWARADRSGRRWPGATGDRLLANGCVSGGRRHVMVPILMGTNSYSMRPAAP